MRIKTLQSTKVILAFLVILGFALVFSGFKTTYAVTASDWNAGKIIEDSLYYNSSDMNTGDIQNFLNSKVPACNTNHARSSSSNDIGPPYTCLKDYIENPTTHQNNANGGSVSGGWTAAQIIKYAADTYSISPKALIVLLQKEQSLITDDWPWVSQYRSATGYGCPDTAPCDSDYYGFYNQVKNAARQFKLYKDNSSSYRYKPFRDNYIQYNPNGSCSGTNVYIQNYATAGLYNYTPYQPNSYALGGGSDSSYPNCGAFGNRNFWKYYNDWFGRSSYTTSLKWEPTAVSQATGKINIFARGTDNRLWQNWYSNGSWQTNWNYIDGPSQGSSSPTAISWYDGHMDVFETRNGEIWHKWYGTPGGWRGWSSLGKPSGVRLGGNVAVVSQSNGKINIFARGNDGRLWQNWFDGHKWQTNWNYIDGPSPASKSPSAISWSDGHMDVFEVRNGNLWHSWYASPGGWRAWSKIGRPSSSNLTGYVGAVTQATGKINIFAKGEDGRMWQNWYSNGSWQTNWNYIDGQLPSASSPSAISWYNGHLDVFEINKGGLRHSYYASGAGGWHGWEELGRP